MNIFASEATTQEQAENTRLSSFGGALALGDLVKSPLGPKQKISADYQIESSSSHPINTQIETTNSTSIATVSNHLMPSPIEDI